MGGMGDFSTFPFDEVVQVFSKKKIIAKINNKLFTSVHFVPNLQESFFSRLQWMETNIFVVVWYP